MGFYSSYTATGEYNLAKKRPRLAALYSKFGEKLKPAITALLLTRICL
ncbi:MAG: hypothetical protein ACI9WS_001601 [Paraglaciecola psychrophila]|jgi:hypothetical protein